MINLKTSYFTRSFTRKSDADQGLQVWGDKFCWSTKTEVKSYDTLCCGCTQSLIIFKARQSLNSYQPISYLIVENESRIYTRAKAQPAEKVGLCARWIYTGKSPTCPFKSYFQDIYGQKTNLLQKRANALISF